MVQCVLLLVLLLWPCRSEPSSMNVFALCQENGYVADFSKADLGKQFGIEGGPTLAGFGANITVAAPLFRDPETPASAIILLEMGTFGIDGRDEGKTQLGYGAKLGGLHPARLAQQRRPFQVFVGGKVTLDLVLTFYGIVSGQMVRDFGERPANCTRPAAAFLVGLPEELRTKKFERLTPVERKVYGNNEYEL